MLFRFDIGARGRSASRLIGDIRSDLLEAVVRRRSDTGMTQEDLASLVDLGRQDLNRQLAGQDELTLHSIAELAWALDKEIHFELREPVRDPGQNTFSEDPAENVSATLRQNEVVGWSSSKAIRTIVAKSRTEDEE